MGILSSVFFFVFVISKTATSVPVSRLEGLTKTDDKGYVDYGSLVSFVGAVSEQNKQDVLYSTLLAQLAADKKFDRARDYVNWYKFYVHILENIGYNLPHSGSFIDYAPTKSTFEISNAIIESIQGLSKSSVEVIKETIDAMKHSILADRELFATHSVSGNSANFQMVLVKIDKNDHVNVVVVGFYFEAANVSKEYLFVPYKSTDVKLKISANIFELNEEVYARVRPTIAQKLGARVKSYIKML